MAEAFEPKETTRDTGIRCRIPSCSGSLLERNISAGEGKYAMEFGIIHCNVCKIMYAELPEQKPLATEDSAI